MLRAYTGPTSLSICHRRPHRPGSKLSTPHCCLEALCFSLPIGRTLASRSSVRADTPVILQRSTAAARRSTAAAAAAASKAAAGMAAPQVAVITTLGCPYCKKAKAALEVRSRRVGEWLNDGLLSSAQHTELGSPACPHTPLAPKCRQQASLLPSMTCRSKWRRWLPSRRPQGTAPCRSSLPPGACWAAPQSCCP